MLKARLASERPFSRTEGKCWTAEFYSRVSRREHTKTRAEEPQASAEGTQAAWKETLGEADTREAADWEMWLASVPQHLGTTAEVEFDTR